MSYVLITGASSGIGAAAAVELTRQGHRVLATGRSPEKLESVHRRMTRVAPSGLRVPDPVHADLSRLDDVEKLADIVLEHHRELDVLVNNAGVQPSRRQESAEGHELTFAVNHLAPFLLTNLLAGLLGENAGRVITTSSSTHTAAAIDRDDIQLTRRWSGRLAYANSKLANILFTTELTRRTGLPASSAHPGSIRTDLNRESPFVRLVKPFERFLLARPEKGADVLVWLATGAEGGAPRAAYYAERGPARTSSAAQDRDLAAWLWDVSEDLVAKVAD
ncbi:SDR family NAD(P)-dependent oxidoreductase [Nonomuraea sp. NPDC059023]